MTRRPSVEWDVYAVTVGPVPASLRVGGTPLRARTIGGVAVLLASPENAPPALEDALRRQHDIVLALSTRFDPLLPVRFGARMPMTRLVEAVRTSGEQLAAALEHVRGRQQMTVRLIGPSSPRGDAGQPAPAITGSDYLKRQRAMHMVPPEAAPLMAAVQPFVVDARVQPGRAGIRASVYHLVESASTAAYRVAATRAIPGLLPWRATVTGPWPAFAFAPELAG